MIVGYAIGVWDLFHVGHLRFLEGARKRCDQLYVGVCSDDLVEETKGQRPVDDEGTRDEILNALKCVDVTHIYDDVDQSEKLSMIQPDILFIGPEYGQLVKQGKTLDACRERGVSVCYLPRTDGVSSTDRRRHAACG